MYKIKYSYATGDSFQNSDEIDYLEFEWKDIEIAKENLQRIKDHYKWYQSHEGYFNRKPVDKPEWHNVIVDGSEEWYLINLKMDNGNEVQLWAPWCGYFESLYGAEIVTEDKGMKFEI